MATSLVLSGTYERLELAEDDWAEARIVFRIDDGSTLMVRLSSNDLGQIRSHSDVAFTEFVDRSMSLRRPKA